MKRLRVRITVKVFLLLLVMALLPLLAAAIVIYLSTTALLRESVGAKLQQVAMQTARGANLFLRTELQGAAALASSEMIVSAAKASNQKYEGLTQAEVGDDFQRIDRSWRAGEIPDELRQRVLSGDAAEFVRSYVQASYSEPGRGARAEVLLADARGALVAASGKTSDFYQADEDWWKLAMGSAVGAPLVTQLGYDESAGVYSLDVAVAVRESPTGPALGVVKTVLNIGLLFNLVAGTHVGETGVAAIVDSEGRVVFAPGIVPMSVSVSPMIRERLAKWTVWHKVEDSRHGAWIMAAAPVGVTFREDRQVSPAADWYVLVRQDAAEAFAPTFALLRRMALWSGPLVLGVLILGFVFARRTVRPVKRLYHGARTLGAGNLDYRIDVRTGDEVEELAAAFNDMAGQLQTSYANLEAKVQERTRELTSLNEEMEDFLRMVSHGLKSPVRAITAFGRFLLEDYGERLDEEGRKYLDRLMAAAHRMDQMINGLLELSQVSRRPSRYITISSEELIERAVDTLQPPDAVEIAWPKGLPVICCDEIKMGQIFLNLLSNSIKFCDKARCIIKIGCTRLGHYWQFSVSDNGIGIADENLGRVFRAFTRLHPDEKYEGTGIGLAIAKWAVEDHGGRIWLESRLGEGSTFYFTVPIHVQDQQAPPVEQAAETSLRP